jgi:hypothetical protein
MSIDSNEKTCTDLLYAKNANKLLPTHISSADASPRPNFEYLDTIAPLNFYTTYFNNPMEADGPFYAWT